MTAKGKRDWSRQSNPVCSTIPGPKYPYARWGKYWANEDEFKKYAKRESDRRRAKDVLGDRSRVDEYLEMEKLANDARALRRKRERRAQYQLDQLRIKYNLKYNANSQTLKKLWEKNRDPEILDFLRLKSSITMGDSERVDRIRALFLDETRKPYDILYEVAIIVGIQLRKKP